MNLNQTYNSEMKSDVYLETGVDKHVEGKKIQPLQRTAICYFSLSCA